jgi:predicted anti-sigma-YlaC factor YlaD
MRGDNNEMDLKQLCARSDVWRLFVLYLNGHVTEVERQRIERHLGECSECKVFLRRVKLLKEARRRKAA